MKVIITKECFLGGAIRKVGSPYVLPEGMKFNPKIMKEFGAEEESPETEEESPETVTKKEIMAQLDIAGIEYKTTQNKTELQALLDETKRQVAPASSGAPDKSLNVI